MTTADVPTFQELPTELKQCLLSAVQDISTLQSIALSCSSYYHAFKNAESLITAHVIHNQVHVDVLPEAMAAFESSRLQLRTREHARNFVHDHLCSRTAPAESCILLNALPLSQLQLCVQYFADGFIAEAFNETSPFGYCDDPPPRFGVSRTEVHRIHRALYRYEVYCNLFRSPTLFELSEQLDLFFLRFSHWENEQLASVHD